MSAIFLFSRFYSIIASSMTLKRNKNDLPLNRQELNYIISLSFIFLTPENVNLFKFQLMELFHS